MEKTSFIGTRCPHCNKVTFHRAKNFELTEKTICSMCGTRYSNEEVEKTPESWHKAFCEAIDEDKPIRFENELEKDTD